MSPQFGILTRRHYGPRPKPLAYKTHVRVWAWAIIFIPQGLASRSARLDMPSRTEDRRASQRPGFHAQ